MSFIDCKKITSLMSDFDRPWFIAGGWALDLFLGAQSREHEDIEIALFRKDQKYLRNFLKNHEFKKVSDGELQTWGDEYLYPPIHELYAIKRGHLLEILLNESKGKSWVFRRDTKIIRPKDHIWHTTKDNIPYLSPEIVLLYKVKNTREKDYIDFLAVKEYLNNEQKKWLKSSIQVHDSNHIWAKLLD